MAAVESEIDLSIASVWRAWQAFERGKRSSPAIMKFRSNLEANLLRLASDLQTGHYRHNGYESFIVHDPKRREISVASVHDRVVHWLLYDYLVSIWDKTLCYDAWNCREGKGLHGAIKRAADHAQKYKNGWIWRSNIQKLFDSIDQPTLQAILRKRVKGQQALGLLDEVITSYNAQSVNQVCLLVTLPAKY